MSNITYLASPYTHSSKVVMRERYEQVMKFTYFSTKRGIVYFSPILYYHPLAVKYKMDVDFNSFIEFNSVFLENSCSIHILTLPGWKQSEGIMWEIKKAKLLNLDIRYIDILEDKGDNQHVRYSIRP